MSKMSEININPNEIIAAIGKNDAIERQKQLDALLEQYPLSAPPEKKPLPPIDEIEKEIEGYTEETIQMAKAVNLLADLNFANEENPYDDEIEAAISKILAKAKEYGVLTAVKKKAHEVTQKHKKEISKYRNEVKAVEKKREKARKEYIKQINRQDAIDRANEAPYAMSVVDFGDPAQPLRGKLRVSNQFLTNKKGIYVIVEDRKGESQEIKISSPVLPVKRHVNEIYNPTIQEEAKNVAIFLAFRDDAGKWQETPVPIDQGDLFDSGGL